MRTEWLRDGHDWLRIAERSWTDPLDPTFARQRGGRWNPPESFATLYLNEDIVTARINLRHFIADWPYEPEDLRAATGPVLVSAHLPRRQRVVDAHTPEGVAGVVLPAMYPIDERGELVGHDRCQPVGEQAHQLRRRGVRCRSARTPEGAGRELAWFPATAASRARPVRVHEFTDWYWT